MPIDYYEKIGNICRANNIKFILDTSGEALKIALKSKPYLIKPNIDEIRHLLGINIESREEIILSGKKLIEMGAENVCISLGKDGMVYLNEYNVYDVKVPVVKCINTVGSGDSTVAGFSVGILRGYKIENLLKFANACGISNALNMETGFVDLGEIDKYQDLVEVKKLS
ncbi:carbohydrate/purine kinase; putative tagatose-6-phosphate kinase LacC [Clostridioides difficile]|nr:carbohydrate/purine kinase; putative tagatose-6-phosphate kinase LacC [Clostridioides difficile]